MFSYEIKSTAHLERFTQDMLREEAPLSPGIRELIADSAKISVSMRIRVCTSSAPNGSSIRTMSGIASIDKFSKNQRKSRQAILNRLASHSDEHSGN
jgi:hypothetical protein